MKEQSCTECNDFMPLKKRITSFFSEREKYKIEWQMMQYTLATILILGIIIEVLAFSLLKDNTIYLKNIPWLWYLIITIAVVFGALWHIRAHKVQVSSMMGMMIGMILGMQAGTMLGIVIGSTNGMFMGSLFGMLFGIFVGVYASNSCGLMGILNGTIMGTMGGTMGTMLALMMKVDYILWFMPFFTIVNILILWGLNFLVFEEIVEGKKVIREGVGFITFFVSCLIMTALMIVIILYGYTSAFAAL